MEERSWLGICRSVAKRFAYERRWSVIPIDLETKKPKIKWKEYQRRIATGSEIDSWGAFNIGVVTGMISGIVVVDCDSMENARWYYLNRKPMGVIVKTPRGVHFYYEHPGFVVKNSRNAENRYDVRGDGGYVLGAGSSRNGVNYHFAMDRHLTVYEQQFEEEQPKESVSSFPRKFSNGIKYITNIMAVSGDSGHKDTWRAVNVLRESGLSKDEAKIAMQVWNQTNAKPPWSDMELAHKINDCYRESSYGK